MQDTFGLQPLPRPLGRGQLFLEKLQWTLATQGSHRLAVAPSKVYLQFFIQFLHIRKLLPIVKIPLVVAVTAFSRGKSAATHPAFCTPYAPTPLQPLPGSCLQHVIANQWAHLWQSALFALEMELTQNWGLTPRGGLWPPSSSSSALRGILFSSCSLRFPSCSLPFSSVLFRFQNFPTWNPVRKICPSGKNKTRCKDSHDSGLFGLVVNLNIDAVDLHPFICPNEDVLCAAQHLGLNQLRPLRVHPNGHIRGGHLHLPGID